MISTRPLLLTPIDTPEKFEAKRAELAEREWARMKENNSATCALP
ncbi:cytochrome c-type protein torC [Escherichia coli]|nr:cytochrome c-type protein torC [Escherichia coli]